MFELAEVLAAKPQERRAVDLRIATYVIVNSGVEFFAVFVEPSLFRLVSTFEKYCARAHVLALARQIPTALQQQDPLARAGQCPHQRSAAGARSDDDDVVMLRHRVL